MLIYVPLIDKHETNITHYIPREYKCDDVQQIKQFSGSVTLYMEGGATEVYPEIIKYRLENKLPYKIILDFSRETFNIQLFDLMVSVMPEINTTKDVLLIHNKSDVRSDTPTPNNIRTLPIDFYIVETYYNCVLGDHPYNTVPVAQRINGMNLLVGKLKARFGRFLTSYYFYKHDLLSTGTLGINAYPEDIENMMKKHPEYLDIDYFETIKKYLGPADHTILHETNEGVTSVGGWPFDPEIFKKSSVSYVCETYDIDRSWYPYLVTEKICRPIINRHPFVVQCCPGQMNMIKSLGFKTFSDLINEDYNNYTTSNFEHVEETVLAGKELIQKIPHNTELVQEIVDFNYNHFCNLAASELVNFRNVVYKFIAKT